MTHWYFFLFLQSMTFNITIFLSCQSAHIPCNMFIYLQEATAIEFTERVSMSRLVWFDSRIRVDSPDPKRLFAIFFLRILQSSRHVKVHTLFRSNNYRVYWVPILWLVISQMLLLLKFRTRTDRQTVRELGRCERGRWACVCLSVHVCFTSLSVLKPDSDAAGGTCCVCSRSVDGVTQRSGVQMDNRRALWTPEERRRNGAAWDTFYIPEAGTETLTASGAASHAGFLSCIRKSTENRRKFRVCTRLRRKWGLKMDSFIYLFYKWCELQILHGYI